MVHRIDRMLWNPWNNHLWELHNVQIAYNNYGKWKKENMQNISEDNYCCCCCCCCCVASVVSDSVRPQRRQPTRLPRPWDSPGKNTGVGCHFLLQCMKVKSESEVAQLCPTLATPWTAAYQAPPSMGFSRQKYWSGVPLPSPEDNYYYVKICIGKQLKGNSPKC